MNNYFTLDGFKYNTPFKEWQYGIDKPMTSRRTWDGSYDVTYGPGIFKTWTGSIRASVTPAVGYGSIADLRATIVKLEGVLFTDHYGDTYTVHVEIGGPERSLSPRWDAPGNVFFIQVRLIAEAA